jgi:hypothetical protein
MVKEILKSRLSDNARDKVSSIYRPWRQELSWRMSPHSWRSYSKIRKLKDIHLGKRCFILGNGPSLKEMDLSPLRDEFTFGLNRIYLLFPDLGFTTSYLVCVNPLVIEQFCEEFNRLEIPLFFDHRGLGSINDRKNVIFLHTRPEVKFSKNPAFYIHQGGTVTYVAMQLAYYFGFSQVILIGVDHSFSKKGPAHKEVVSEGDDLDHFAPNYFGKGVRWQLPDLERSELAYQLAREIFIENGREIIDATVGGKLQVFSKVPFKSLF